MGHYPRKLVPSQNPNLFYSLLKYASYKYKQPKENQLSGALAFLLSEIPEARFELVGLIQERYQEKFPRSRRIGVHPFRMAVRTQSTHHRTLVPNELTVANQREIIDIEIGFKNEFGIFIECKVDASLGHRQDYRYERALKKAYPKGGILVFLSRDADFSLNSSAIECSWTEVSSRFATLLRRLKSPVKKYIVRHFLDYLKEEGMGEFDGFNKGELFKSWNQFYPALGKYIDLLEEVKRKLKSQRYQTNPISDNTKESKIAFRIIPKQISSTPRKKGKWGHSDRYIECGFLLYSRITEGQEFDTEASEGIYPYLNIRWGRSISPSRKAKLKLSRNHFWFWHGEPGCGNDVTTLDELLKGIRSPAEQFTKVSKFFSDSLKVVEKSRIIPQLVRGI